MTNPTTHDDVVKAIEQVQEYLPENDDRAMHLSDLIHDALPAARRAAEAEKALDWLLENTMFGCLGKKDCPEIIRKKLEGK